MSATSLVDIAMPRLSDQMEEAVVSRWLKAAGDSVSRGEPLVEVETDKATMVYEAEFDGVLEELVVAEGGTAALGEVIARARASGTPSRPSAPKPAAASRSVEAPAPAPPARRNGGEHGRHRATPVARRLAEELGVSLDGVSGSGPGGRIVRADVRKASREGAAPRPAEVGAEVQLTTTQRTIARRMAESRTEIPEFTLEAEIDMESAATLREELRVLERDPLPSFNDLVVKAVGLALRRHPGLNATFGGDRINRLGRINVGIAVATEDALYVPTVHDADEKSVFEIAELARALIKKVGDGTITPDELADGTFTVSNLGMFGIRRFNAVIYPPQAAILAVGEVARRPVVSEDGEIVARYEMDVALSCDHRVVYGAEAAKFLQTLKSFLERPVALVAS
jgi:pyruvate dehydrogenase E2 component (dihydrolipoamide acetyltransferase)